MGVIKTGGAGGQGSDRPEGIECPKWERVDGSKRCKHYLAGGSCALPDELMCVEWLKLNDQEAYDRAKHAPALSVPPAVPERPTGPSAAPEPSAPQPPAPEANGAQRGDEAPPRRHLGVAVANVPDELSTAPHPFDPAVLTDAALAELEAAGVEVRVASTDLDDVWLVPAFTDQDRPELTYRMARTLLVTMSILPGATLRAIRRPNHKDQT